MRLCTCVAILELEMFPLSFNPSVIRLGTSKTKLELTFTFLIIGDLGQDHGNSLSERLEAKLTNIQVGTSNEHTTAVAKVLYRP